jgi:hypothetical protein
MLNNVVIWCPAEARNKPCATGIVVRVAPVRVRAPHGCLSDAEGLLVQRRICIRPIEFCEVVLRDAELLKLGDFGEVKVADFHGWHDHLKSLFPGRAHGWAHHLDIAQHLQNRLIEPEIARR